MQTRIVTVAVLMGLGGVFWVTTEALRPTIAQAYTARVDLSLDRQSNESYESLVRRAETAATTAAQSSFNQDTGVADVSVTIVAQNQGAIAPILSLQVSRNQWYSSPEPQRWAKYFNNAKVLLQFENIAKKTPTQVGTTNPTTTFGGAANSYPNQLGANRVNGINRGRSTSGIFGPNNARERVNGFPGQAGTVPSTSGQPNNSYPGQVGNPNSIIPQTPAPGSGMAPQPAVAAPVTNLGNTQTTTQQNNSIPGVTSTQTPTNVLPTPAAP